MLLVNGGNNIQELPRFPVLFPRLWNCFPTFFNYNAPHLMEYNIVPFFMMRSSLFGAVIVCR